MSTRIITLLSGLGRRDASVSVAKAALMKSVPGAVIADLSHDIAESDLQEAAYLLLSSYRYFPKGAAHVLMLDIFSGAPPRLLLVHHDGHYFISPDNEALSLAFGDIADVRLCFEFASPFHFHDWLHHAAIAVAGAISGNITAFKKYELVNSHAIMRRNTSQGSVDCNVRYIDHYENVVLDITKLQFTELIGDRSFSIRMPRNEDITTISVNYNDVPHGKPLCRFNDAGFLEIAFNHGKAATTLGLAGAHETNARYRTIKIFT